MPLLGARPCSKGSKIRSSSPSLRPGPRSTTRTTTSPFELFARELDRSVRRELQRVVDQVHEHELDLGAVDLDRVELGGERDRHALGAALRARTAPGRRGVSIVQSSGFGSAAPSSSRERSSRLATRPVEPLRLHVDRREQARAVGSSLSSRVGALEPVGRGADRGQRRAQVVADRPEDRGLDRVAPAQGLGLDGAPSEPLAVDRDGEQGRK